MTLPSSTTPTNPSSDATPAADETKRRSQFSGFEQEIIEKVIGPRVNTAIDALNDSKDGVSAASISRWFAANCPGSNPSDSTVSKWLKALNIRISTRAYVDRPPTAPHIDPRQQLANARLQEVLAAQRKMNDSPNPTATPGIPGDPGFTVAGAGAPGSPLPSLAVNPAFVPAESNPFLNH